MSLRARGPEAPRVHITPMYVDGPEGKLLLGFPNFAMDYLRKKKQLYFVSWSMDFRNSEKFRGNVAAFHVEELAGAREGEGIIEVSVEGPFDLEGFTDEYVPHSSVRSLAELKQGIEDWNSYRGPVRPQKLFLWLARRK